MKYVRGELAFKVDKLIVASNLLSGTQRLYAMCCHVSGPWFTTDMSLLFPMDRYRLDLYTIQLRFTLHKPVQTYEEKSLSVSIRQFPLIETLTSYIIRYKRCTNKWMKDRYLLDTLKFVKI